MAGGLAADDERRARLHVQVEHGLDARHARVLRARPRPPPLPPRRADLLARLRLGRELRPPALARRGRARQAVAARANARRPVAASWRTCARSTATCGRIPGKQLLFMGGELAQQAEWSEEAGSLDWHLLDDPDHAGVRALVRDLNAAYRDEPALWQRDHTPDGFAWLEGGARDENLLAFARFSAGRERVLVCICNLSPVPRERPPRAAASGRHVAGGAQHGLPLLRRDGRRQPRRDRGRGRAAQRLGPLGRGGRCRRSATVWLAPDDWPRRGES